MTDLYITITDENNDVLRKVNIYYDGSDSQTTNEIADDIIEAYDGAKDITGDINEWFDALDFNDTIEGPLND